MMRYILSRTFLSFFLCPCRFLSRSQVDILQDVFTFVKHQLEEKIFYILSKLFLRQLHHTLIVRLLLGGPYNEDKEEKSCY